MKKKIMIVALFLFAGCTYVSAAGFAPQIGNPRVTRNILSTQLPAGLLTDIKTDYSDYWITECYEKDRKKQADYFITLENADQTVQLKSIDKDQWEVISTIVKE